MKESLQEGLHYSYTYKVPENKTVPELFPEAEEFQVMPKVFATGYLVGLVEWTCIKALKEHLDWPKEQTVGIGATMTHQAATPPGLIITVTVTLDKIDGKKLTFSFKANDSIDTITKGTHDRFIIDIDKFNANLEKKMK